jgi:tetratricopeptide (TPR) repeat protein
MKCPNCESENSISTAECYHCGFPLGGKPRKKKHKLVVWVVFVVLAGILLLSFPLIQKKADGWVVKGKRTYFTFIGEQDFSLNKYSAAVASYSQAIKLGGASARLFAQRGQAYYQLGEYDLAREDFSRAVEMAPQEGKYLLSRGKTYLMLKQKAAASEDLTVAARAGNLEAHSLLLTMANDHRE